MSFIFFFSFCIHWTFIHSQCTWISQFFYKDIHHPTEVCIQYRNTDPNSKYLYEPQISWKYHCEGSDIPQIYEYTDINCEHLSRIIPLESTDIFEMDFNCIGSPNHCNNTVTGIIDDCNGMYINMTFVKDSCDTTIGCELQCTDTHIAQRYCYLSPNKECVPSDIDAYYSGPSIPSQLRFPTSDVIFPSIFTMNTHGLCKPIWNCIYDDDSDDSDSDSVSDSDSNSADSAEVNGEIRHNPYAPQQSPQVTVSVSLMSTKSLMVCLSVLLFVLGLIVGCVWYRHKKRKQRKGEIVASYDEDVEELMVTTATSAYLV